MQTAVWLMYAGAIISAISFILGLATIGGVKKAYEKNHPAYTSTQINNPVTLGSPSSSWSASSASACGYGWRG